VRRIRTRLLAAGGAVLAQAWGLGFGVNVAHAAVAAANVAAANVVPADVARANLAPANVAPADVAPAGSGIGSGEVAGVLDTAGAGTGTVDQLLRSRIKAGGLPLPGQTAAVPDAFAIAAVLLPSVPRQSGAPAVGNSGGRPPGAGRPVGAIGLQGRRGSVGSGGTGAAAKGAWSPEAAWGRYGTGPGGTGDRAAADGGSAAFTARTSEVAASRDGGRPLVGALRGPLDGESFTEQAEDESVLLGREAVAAASATNPLQASGMETAVLIPIAAGLLLTGAAMYKHRGLPRGH
jgi:hypothetical protein